MSLGKETTTSVVSIVLVIVLDGLFAVFSHRSECSDASSQWTFAIRVHHLVVGFRRRIVIDYLALDVRGSEILGLVDAFGGYKSALMRTIIGLIPCQGSEIEVTKPANPRQPRPDHTENCRAMRMSVPARLAVLVSHDAAEHSVFVTRKSRTCRRS